MAAPVRLEEEVFTDPAVDALAALLGLADRDSAVGKLARLWAWQTEHYTDAKPTYAVPRAILIGIFGARGPEAMVDAGLAALQPDGLYKIHGSDKPNGKKNPKKTRINWLYLERGQRKEAGTRSAEVRAEAGDPRGPGGQFGALPTADQRQTNGTPTADQRDAERPPSSPFSVLSSLPESLSPARGALGALVDHAIDRLNAARRKVDPTASPIPLIADQPCRELLDHLRPIDAGERRAVLDRAIDVMLATLDARRDPVGEYRMAMLSGEKAWARWRDGTVAGARGRDGPAGRATGRAPPARIDSTDEIDPTTIRPRPRA